MPKLEKVEAYICPVTGLIVTPKEIDGVTGTCFKCLYDGGWDGEQKCEYADNNLPQEREKAEAERKKLEARLASMIVCPKCGHKIVPMS